MNSGKSKIVIIDDEEDLCFLLGNMLLSQGFSVSSYYTLEAGMKGIRAQKPDWVILDNDLPDGRGWDNTDEILSAAPGISIIKISANPDSHRTHYLKNVHYLIKPIHVNSITELINKNSIST